MREQGRGAVLVARYFSYIVIAVWTMAAILFASGLVGV
jgi:hypothetical protein